MDGAPRIDVARIVDQGLARAYRAYLLEIISTLGLGVDLPSLFGPFFRGMSRVIGGTNRQYFWSHSFLPLVATLER